MFSELIERYKAIELEIKELEGKLSIAEASRSAIGCQIRVQCTERLHIYDDGSSAVQGGYEYSFCLLCGEVF